VVYPQWATLEESIREDKRTYGLPEFSKQEHQAFNLGIATLTVPSAKALAKQYDFSQHERVLDLAGGMGLFLTMAIQQHQEIEGTLFELPKTAQLAQKRLVNTPLANKITIIEGDLFKDDIPTGYDAVILANIVHVFSPDTNLVLLNRIRQAVAKGTKLLLVDFWTDATHTQPKFAALMAAEFQIFSGEGDVYSTEEVGNWLGMTNWRVLKDEHLAGATSVIVAEAV
jgi:cyclopropane fatty-acyl-phospholipid synthase-like methyltransferase